MDHAKLVRSKRISVTTYSVHVSLGFRTHTSGPVEKLLDSFMEALADLDEKDPSLLDWSVGADSGTGVMDVVVTITAPHHADAVAHAHRIIRQAAEAAAQSRAGILEVAGNDIAVFA